MPELNLELGTLRMVRTRERYDRFAKMIPAGTVNAETRSILKRMGEFFEKTEAEEVTHDQFWPFLRTLYPKWKDKDIEFWSAAVRPISKPNPPGLDETIIENLLATALGNTAIDLINSWQEGGEVDLGPALRTAVEDFEAAVERKVKTPDVVFGWDEMVNEETHNIGLHWRLPCIATHLRALRPGDFGIIAMRPDRGKTTMVASEITHMAPQLAELYPDEFRPVLWLNNEGPGNRILSRLRQSALGLSAVEIREMGIEKAQAAYIELMGGREDRIQVQDIHGYTNWDVEELIRKKKPGLVVYDMIDNIRFSGGTANNGERNDQVLEAMYQWARVLGVRYEFAGLATSQISAEGEGMRFPLQSQLKDSRTGKQGACDFILTGGFDPSMPNTRFIGATKNKLKMNGMKASPECPAMFDADRGRLKMPEVA